MTRPKFRVAAQIHPQQGDFSALREAAIQAEEMGYDIVYTWDHFYPLYGDPDGKHFECWTTLAALAEATSRVEIGPLVACNSYRNPHLVASMAQTIDHISDGRFILGLGSGWFRRDYEEYGYEFGSAGSRLRHLERNLPEIERRLGLVNPLPRRKVPILIAGIGEQITTRLVARHADSWHARFPRHPDMVRPAIEALHHWCEVEGRDSDGIERGLGLDPRDLDRFLFEDVDAYVELGFTQFTLGFNGPGWDVSTGAEWLEWRDRMNG
jgi:probable F420-dependent oxidoreductase